MIERVARAICKEDGQDWRTLESTYNGRQRQHDYRRFARAAVEAMQSRQA